MPTLRTRKATQDGTRLAAWRDLKGKTALVTGGSRGFGRGIVETLVGHDMRVIALARDKDRLDTLRRDLKGRLEVIASDATDGLVAARIVERERPNLLVLNAGAYGTHRPTRLHTWETFSVFWETDVKAAFLWAREGLLLPLDPGGVIIIGSSMAATSSSPLIASYAAAKSALWTLSRCLAAEAKPLGLRVHCLLPTLTSETDMGRDALASFARRLGVPESQVREQMLSARALTPTMVGAAVLRILTDPRCAGEVGFKVSASGIEPMSKVDPTARR